jgi:hypothetical protein
MSRRRVGCLAFCCVVALPVTLQFVYYLYRPMFADEFGRSDRWIAAGWIGTPGIVFDREGTGFKCDRMLNTIVVFHGFWAEGDATDETLYDKSELIGSLSPSFAESWNGARFRSVEGVEYEVPRVRNRVFVFERDGTRREFALQPEMASECLHAVNGDERVNLGIIAILRRHGVMVPTDNH